MWSPHVKKDIALREDVQKSLLRLCCEQWVLSYAELLILPYATYQHWKIVIFTLNYTSFLKVVTIVHNQQEYAMAHMHTALASAS